MRQRPTSDGYYVACVDFQFVAEFKPKSFAVLEILFLTQAVLPHPRLFCSSSSPQELVSDHGGMIK